MENRSYRKCTICGKRKLPKSDMLLASFPLDSDQCRLWVKASGIEDLVHVPIEKLHNLRYICGSHFAPDCFNAKGNRLLATAVPTLGLTRPLLPDDLFTEFPLHVKSYYDKIKKKPCKQTDSSNKTDMNMAVETITESDKEQVHNFRDKQVITTANELCVVTNLIPIPSTSTTSSHLTLERRRGVPMHSFPSVDRFPERFKDWINLVGGKLETELDYESYKKKVCHIHFTEKDWNHNNQLNALAVPSLHLRDSSNSSLEFYDVEYIDSELSSPLHENTDDMQSPSDLHDALKPISWLAGTWVTENGRGQYPNLKDFQYHEELEFICIEKGSPMHQERGFLRIKPGTNELAFVVSHNFGLNSLEEGQVDPEKKEIKLSTVNLMRMSFAKPPEVKRFKREIKLLDHNTLQIVLYMETENTKMCEHLRAVYTRKNETDPLF